MSLPHVEATRTIHGPGAWTRDSITRDQWLAPLPAECWAELKAAMRSLSNDPRPLHALSPDAFPLDATRAFAADLKRTHLQSGPMFALVDRFPVRDHSKEDLKKAYWLFASVLSRPVQQTFDGRMLFEVRDVGLGGKMTPGSGIRATITNLDLLFHNDNCFNETMPDYVSLFCLRAAKTGGVSKAVSFQTLHNILRDESPELLERLYEPVWWDRHREHAPDDTPVIANPVFTWQDGMPRARFSNYNIRGGYRIREESPDPVLAAALDRLLALFATPELQVQFTMEPGQIQIVNNPAIGHARSEFVDHDDFEERRHLARLWLREGGRVGYRG